MELVGSVCRDIDRLTRWHNLPRAVKYKIEFAFQEREAARPTNPGSLVGQLPGKPTMREFS